MKKRKSIFNAIKKYFYKRKTTRCVKKAYKTYEQLEKYRKTALKYEAEYYNMLDLG